MDEIKNAQLAVMVCCMYVYVCLYKLIELKQVLINKLN